MRSRKAGKGVAFAVDGSGTTAGGDPLATICAADGDVAAGAGVRVVGNGGSEASTPLLFGGACALIKRESPEVRSALAHCCARLAGQRSHSLDRNCRSLGELKLLLETLDAHFLLLDL